MITPEQINPHDRETIYVGHLKDSDTKGRFGPEWVRETQHLTALDRFLIKSYDALRSRR